MSSYTGRSAAAERFHQHFHQKGGHLQNSAISFSVALRPRRLSSCVTHSTATVREKVSTYSARCLAKESGGEEKRTDLPNLENFFEVLLRATRVRFREESGRKLLYAAHPQDFLGHFGSSLIKLCISHLKCFLFAWLCVSISDYAVTRIYSGYALTGYCLQFNQVSLFHTCLLWSLGSLDSINSHTGLS